MYNKAILIGRLTANPEIHVTPNGVNVTSFRIDVDRAMSKERKADFLTVQAWRSSAEFVCKYFTKGKPIGIEGSIQTRDYTDKDGNKRTATEIVADRVFFVGGKDSKTGQEETQPSAEADTMLDPEDDLPF